MLVRGYRYTLYDVIVFSSTVCYATNGSCELGKGQKNFMLSLLLMLKIVLRMQVSHSTVSRWWMKRPSRTPWIEYRASQTERTKLYTRDCPVVNQFHSIRYP
jgi:hypothetical protein